VLSLSDPVELRFGNDMSSVTVAEALKAVPVREAPLTHEVARWSRRIELPHEDPADRFLAASARVYDLTLVTADELPDPHRLQIRLWVNGMPKQDFNTSDMAHKIPRCIEWISSIHPLEPGDVIATGTNHRGLSAFQNGASDCPARTKPATSAAVAASRSSSPAWRNT
jgi:hypothetical protein